MFARRCVRGLLLLCLGSSVVGCSNPSGLDSIQVTPASQSLTVGQTAQLTAVGTYGNASHPSTQNITTAVTWSSNTPAVATVSDSGLVTGVAAGTTIITADSEAFNGPVSSSSQLTVTSAGGGPAGGGGSGGSGGTGGSGGNILSLTIIPSGIVFGTLGDSGQFLAIGTFSTAPTVRDVTNSVTWITSEPNVFPITNYGNGAPGGGTENGGVVSDYEASVGPVGAVITAEATDSNGSIATATANVGCPYVLP
ncbi:MAG TPA: Ig-like domain-containing protein, partial [Acidobacteriaceae bacterium]|nr:Ig-like domain-containing protein [Acidobacteriaceae bacterium]